MSRLPALAVSGLIEGFYGRPWSWADRHRAVEFLAENGANTYVYAPKNDPLHRDRWREPYLPEEWRRFAELVRHCDQVGGVDFWFGISPLGLRIAGSDDLDRLLAKFEAAAAHAGVRHFCLLVDDMPDAFATSADAERFGSLAAAHAHVVEWVRQRLAERDPAARLWFVPLHYHGDPERDYVRDIGAAIHPDVAIMWTGPEVCSEFLTAEHTAAVSASLRRPVLYWDNHPVNDGGMRFDPHLGPLRGREAGLAGAALGLLSNVAIQPEASLIAVATFAAFAHDPDGYDPDHAWHNALLSVAGDPTDAEAVAVLADLARRSPLQRGDPLANALAGPLASVRATWPNDDARVGALAGVRRMLDDLASVARRLDSGLHNVRLRADLAPWAGKLTLQVTAALGALDVLVAVLDRPDADVRETREQVVALLVDARRTFHWVAGDQLEEFARWCLRSADELAADPSP